MIESLSAHVILFFESQLWRHKLWLYIIFPEITLDDGPKIQGLRLRINNFQNFRNKKKFIDDFILENCTVFNKIYS